MLLRCGFGKLDGTRYRLGPIGGLALSAWAAGCTVCGLFLLLAQRSMDDEEDGSLRFAAALLDFLGVVFVSASAIAYVYVSMRAPRPMQLHAHGTVIILLLAEIVMLMWMEASSKRDLSASSMVMLVCIYIVWGFRKMLLYELMTQKVIAVGARLSRCLDARLWGWVLVVSTGLTALIGGVLGLSWSSVLEARGVPVEDIQAASKFGRQSPGGKVTVFDEIIMSTSIFCAGVGSMGFVAGGSALCIVAYCYVRSALRKLRQREVLTEELAHVRRTLRQHLTGVLVSTISTLLVIITQITDLFDLFGDESIDNIVGGVVFALDVAGDTAAIFLLSGIGVLLFREDPDAGDITGHIRSLLHAAVLTSRAEVVFEGCVTTTPSNSCICSFPGKFLEEWNALTWLCEQGQISSACVFLPTADPLRRFGRHTPCPETEGKCWCYSLYGEEKPWGCKWFEAWKANIERAVQLKLDLVAVFFPGECGYGVVNWEELASADLWDGVGLGGSQKAEVAYLKKCGYKVVEQDLSETGELLSRNLLEQQACRRSRSMRTEVPTPASSCQAITPITPITK